MALRAPAPLPAAGRGTIYRCPLVGLPPLAACYSTYLSCTRACFAFAVARCCHRRCLVAFFVLRAISASRRRPCSSIVGLLFSIARRPSLLSLLAPTPKTPSPGWLPLRLRSRRLLFRLLPLSPPSPSPPAPPPPRAAAAAPPSASPSTGDRTPPAALVASLPRPALG